MRPFRRLERYDLMADVLRANPNEWVKVSPGSMNGRRNTVTKALNHRLGAGDVQIKQHRLDIWARYLTLATVPNELRPGNSRQSD